MDLSSTEEESTSIIYAKYNNIKLNSLEIKYTKEPISYINNIVLNLSGKDYDITNSFLYGTSPLFSTVPSAQYYFVLDIVNSNLLSSVIVTSTKNGETKYFTADYDSATQKWYTELTKISDYLPGDLNILIVYKDKIYPYTENGSLKNDFFNTNNMDPFTLNNLNQVAESLKNDGINVEATQINDVLSINEDGKEGNSVYNRVVLSINENENDVEELISTVQMSSYNTSISNTLSETDISSMFGTNLSDTKLQELKQITYLDILTNSEQYGFIKVKCENVQILWAI